MNLNVLYFIIINLVAYYLMHSDKQKAIKNKWRIKESTLLGTAIIGGSIGAIFGMYNFRHKTKHLKFRVGLPLILLAQILIYFYVN